MYGGPSQVDTFDYKPELYKLDGKTIPIKTFGRGGKKNEGRVVGPQVEVPAVWPVGQVRQRPLPQPGHLRRRHRLPALDDGRLADPRLGHAPDEHRQDPLGEPVPGLVGELRPGERQRESARLRRHARPDRRADQRVQELVERLHAGDLSGDHPPIRRSARSSTSSGPKAGPRPSSGDMLDALRGFNEDHHAERPDNSNLAARIASYEMAFAMQRHAPEAVGFEGEIRRDQVALRDRRQEDRGFRPPLPPGPPTGRARGPVRPALRRRGHNDSNWDAHGNLIENHNYHAGRTDKPIAGLLKDLKRRGLLDETLVIWGGEFGRQPTAEYAEGTGRDHNAYGFTMWMAGGGIKGGVSVGETDELGRGRRLRPVPRQEPPRHGPPADGARPQPPAISIMATSTTASTRSWSASKGPTRSSRVIRVTQTRVIHGSDPDMLIVTTQISLMDAPTAPPC